jgi:hypothetical protein
LSACGTWQTSTSTLSMSLLGLKQMYRGQALEMRRGCISVAVSCPHPYSQDFTAIHQSTDSPWLVMPRGRRNPAQSGGFQSTSVDCRDVAINGFIMSRSGVRIPLAAPPFHHALGALTTWFSMVLVRSITLSTVPSAFRYRAGCAAPLLASAGRAGPRCVGSPPRRPHKQNAEPRPATDPRRGLGSTRR